MRKIITLLSLLVFLTAAGTAQFAIPDQKFNETGDFSALLLDQEAAKAANLGILEINSYHTENGVEVSLKVEENRTLSFEGDVVVREDDNEYVLLMEESSGEIAVTSGNNTETISYSAPGPRLSQSRSTEGFLVKESVIRVENEYPLTVREDVELQLSGHERFLVTFETVPDSSEFSGLEATHIWDLELEPGESTEIIYTVNIGFPLAILTALTLAVIGFKLKKGRFYLDKEVEIVDGEIKTVLTVRNGRDSVQRNLVLRDFVPGVVEPTEFETGSPEISNPDRGTRVEWGIEELQPGESRVLVYRLKPNFDIKADIEFGRAELLDDEGFTVFRTARRTLKVDPEELN